jgi:hypothetical protein
MDSFMVYLGAVICTLYGLRSVIAGIRNEKKSYWVSIGWDDTKKLLKDKHDKVNNILWGGIVLGAGIAIFIWY